MSFFDRYVDENTRETPEARRDCEQAASGGSASIEGIVSCRSHPIEGFMEITYYQWRKEFGGLKLDQVKRLKSLIIRTPV